MILNFFVPFEYLPHSHYHISSISPVSSHPTLSSCFLSHYLHRSMRDESPDRDRSGNSILFRHCFVLFISKYVETLKSVFWSCFLVERHDHLLKIARLIMSSLEFWHIGIKLPSCVQSSLHLLTH